MSDGIIDQVKEHDRAELTSFRASQGHRIPMHTVGTIVHIYPNKQFLEVEFIIDGNPKVATLNHKDVCWIPQSQ